MACSNGSLGAKSCGVPVKEEGTSFTKVESPATLPFGIPDDEVTTAIDGRGYLDAKRAAMREHATQISVEGPFYALSDGIGLRALGTEYYTLVSPGPPTRPAPSADGPREDDLFAGIG